MDILKELAVSAKQLAGLLQNRKSGDAKRLKEAYNKFHALGVNVSTVALSGQLSPHESKLVAILLTNGKTVASIVMAGSDLSAQNMPRAEQIMAKYDCLNNAILAFSISVEFIFLYKNYGVDQN